jgi:hypothetical protein
MKEITPEMVDLYRKLAHYNFDCGDYQSACEKLANYISLFASPPAQALDHDEEELAAAGITSTGSAKDSNNNTNSKDKDSIGNPAMYYLKQVDPDMLQVLWGRLACEILVEDWQAAAVAVDAVKTAMESLVAQHKLSHLSALQQRTWLLHWSLFVYWNDSSSKGGLEQLVDLFQSEKYRQAITTNAPHLLRYLTAAT